MTRPTSSRHRFRQQVAPKIIALSERGKPTFTGIEKALRKYDEAVERGLINEAWQRPELP